MCCIYILQFLVLNVGSILMDIIFLGVKAPAYNKKTGKLI